MSLFHNQVDDDDDDDNDSNDNDIMLKMTHPHPENQNQSYQEQTHDYNYNHYHHHRQHHNYINIEDELQQLQKEIICYKKILCRGNVLVCIISILTLIIYGIMKEKNLDADTLVGGGSIIIEGQQKQQEQQQQQHQMNFTDMMTKNEDVVMLMNSTMS